LVMISKVAIVGNRAPRLSEKVINDGRKWRDMPVKNENRTRRQHVVKINRTMTSNANPCNTSSPTF
jgi:hypothetical protein